MGEKRDNALTNATQRVEELRAAIAAAEASIAILKEQIRVDAAALRRAEKFVATWQEMADGGTVSATRPKNPDRREVADRALAIIRSFGRPLARRELLEKLSASGVRIEGKDPEVVLGTMLYRDDRIVRLRGYGYWPKDEAYDPAFYLPEHEAVIGATERDG
ncbi:hypothetical protein [Mesorhizobium amorphae]|uniref:hypothetical protein n=1 Tax=Mesorhizobium amorphae TaxID=71433 RepID=UPI00177CA686|nr:hypothetical protein [Mesorhizobium amorphae]